MIILDQDVCAIRELVSPVGKGLVTPKACDTVPQVGYSSRLHAMDAFEHADLAGLNLFNSDAAEIVRRVNINRGGEVL